MGRYRRFNSITFDHHLLREILAKSDPQHRHPSKKREMTLHLDGHIHGGHVEGLEHDLRHSLPVGLGVQGCLGEQHRVLLRVHPKLVVPTVGPDLLHVLG